MIRRYRVEGLVQGVGFRWFVRACAEELGLEGWVRNTADGAVDVMARGLAPQLDLLFQALSQGPIGSRVDRVIPVPAGSEEGPASGKGFVIR